MAKDRFGYGEDDMKKGWEYTSKNAPYTFHDSVRSSSGSELLEEDMRKIIENKGLKAWKKFIKKYDSRIEKGIEGPGEFWLERLSMDFPDLYTQFEDSDHKEYLMRTA